MYNRVTGLDSSKLQLTGAARTFTDTIKLTQQMAHLPFATISSLTEPMILLTRIDDTQGKLSAGGAVGKAIIKGLKKDLRKLNDFHKRATGKEVKGFADMNDEYWTEAYKVGLALEQGVMAHIEGLYGEAPKHGVLQDLQNAFFKANFLTTWTGSVQLAAFTTGKRLIRENTEKLYNHQKGIQKLSESRKDYLTAQLNDLGIDEKGALNWYEGSLVNGVFDEGRSRGAYKADTSDQRKAQLAFYENRLTNGANRFTREIILNPSTSEANRPLWFSTPAGQLLAQFAGYPTVFNNTILKRWSYEAAEDLRKAGKGQLPQATPKIVGTALAMTTVATFMNAVRSGGASLDQDDETILLEAIQRWGGLGPADTLYRTQQNAMYGSGPAGTAFKMLPGPIISDVVDTIAYRKGIPEILLTNTPFYSALPSETRKSLRKDARDLQKGLAKGLFGDEETPKYIPPSALYAKGGVVRFNFVVGGIARSILKDVIKSINKPTPSLKEIEKLRERIAVESKAVYDNWFDKLSKQDKFEITNKERDAMYDVNTSAFIGEGNLGARDAAEQGYVVPMDHVKKFYKENPEIEKLDILSYKLFE